MSNELSYKTARSAMSDGGRSGTAASDPRAQQIVTSSAVKGVAVTPADSALASGPCDAFYLSADADVVVRLAEDTSNITLAGLKGGQHYAFSCIRIVSTTAGTVTALWFQKP